MRFDHQLEVCIVSLLCTVASLTFSSAEVKGHAEGHSDPCHPEGLAAAKSKSCLEEELKELRDSVDENRHLIDSLEKREEHAKGGQPEFPDSDLHASLTESHPDVESVEEADDLTDVRRYATTTLRTVDVEEPVMEDAADDDDDEEADDDESSGDTSVPQKRSGGADDDYDEDGDDDESDDDEDDDEDDDDDADDEIKIRKKKNGKNVIDKTEKRDKTSTVSATSMAEETSTDSTSSTAETSTESTASAVVETTTASKVATTKREELRSRYDEFLERDKKSGAVVREADFEGVGKLKQIREIDKKVDQKLKEKYINAVEPRADEELLELMVKIAENPRDWNAVHSMLQQLDEDIAVVQQIENEAKNLENKRNDNGVETKSKTSKLTKEERKQQQAEKKKKKKKKKQRQKEKLEREEKLREESEKPRSDEETLRRLQLERAGLLNAAGRTMKDQGRHVKTTTAQTVPSTTTTMTTTTTTVTPVATTWLPKELQGGSKLKPYGASKQMKTLDSAIDVLSKDHARIVLNPSQWPRPKSPMQEVREKWPKVLSNLEHPINTAKAIVTGRLRPSADKGDWSPKTTSESNEWSKLDIASVMPEDKERARERFFKETVFAKNNVVHWKPNAKTKWLETRPLPSKEHRANSHNNYFNGEPNRKQTVNGWPDFSINALKHGNIDTANEEVAIAEQSGQDDWPNLPVDADRDWPDFPPNTVDANSLNGWNRKQQAMSNNWPGISHNKALEHAKEVAGSKQWPHFAYHRVTSSPLQSRQRQQQEAQQRARHRSAYIAVSIISPPKNRSAGINATRKATVEVANESRPLPDKMDALLDERSGLTRKLTPVDPLEEQLIDMAASGMDARNRFNWNHSRHLDKIQEQLKTLGAMEAKLQAQWLEKERLRQILRDGGKSGSYYRDVRSEVPRVAASAAASSFDTKKTSEA